MTRTQVKWLILLFLVTGVIGWMPYVSGMQGYWYLALVSHLAGPTLFLLITMSTNRMLKRLHEAAETEKARRARVAALYPPVDPPD